MADPKKFWPNYVALTGFAQVGKDTASEVFNRLGYKRVALADPLRQLAYQLDPEVRHEGVLHPLSALVDRIGWERAKLESSQVRPLLKRLGTAARAAFGGDFWIDRAIDYARGEPTVFTDIRFLNEQDRLRETGLRVAFVRITRPGYEQESSFEAEVPHIETDFEVQNVGTIETFREEVAAAFRRWMIDSNFFASEEVPGYAGTD